ncbi:hypothetical protein PoB_003107300 [Plakobranchus ocellatus]|uniref:ShKT domain-containing protein n=1 Tax=Plakobranchus ocellatus TaxID=259542 RepID=A0AAV4ABD9_9GAST|nr:hypothetical protein PoB_003107300 [Plakobranchus ocellatus]
MRTLRTTIILNIVCVILLLTLTKGHVNQGKCEVFSESKDRFVCVFSCTTSNNKVISGFQALHRVGASLTGLEVGGILESDPARRYAGTFLGMATLEAAHKASPKSIEDFTIAWKNRGNTHGNSQGNSRGNSQGNTEDNSEEESDENPQDSTTQPTTKSPRGQHPSNGGSTASTTHQPTTQATGCVDTNKEWCEARPQYCASSADFRLYCLATCNLCPAPNCSHEPFWCNSHVSRCTTSESRQKECSCTCRKAGVTIPSTTKAPRTAATTARPTAATTSSSDICADTRDDCHNNAHKCNRHSIRELCPKTCGICNETQPLDHASKGVCQDYRTWCSDLSHLPRCNNHNISRNHDSFRQGAHHSNTSPNNTDNNRKNNHNHINNYYNNTNNNHNYNHNNNHAKSQYYHTNNYHNHTNKDYNTYDYYNTNDYYNHTNNYHNGNHTTTNYNNNHTPTNKYNYNDDHTTTNYKHNHTSINNSKTHNPPEQSIKNSDNTIAGDNLQLYPQTTAFECLSQPSDIYSSHNIHPACRICINLDTCFKDWYQESSDLNECVTFDPRDQNTEIKCNYCCVGDDCNKGVKPAISSLYTKN